MDYATYSKNVIDINTIRPILLQLSYDDYLTLFILFVGATAYLSKGTLWAKPDPYTYKLYERPQEKFGLTVREERSKDIAKRLDQENKDLVIFWGSQSGTAERFAHRLARDCSQAFGLSAIVADFTDYDNDTIAQISNSKIALFLISTYGEGDPSDNTTEFLAWIQKRSKALSNLRYAAFGLGNSNYVYYNKVVDQIEECLKKLGAQQMLPTGKADDANSSTEEDFASWRDDLFAMFHNKLGLEERAPEYSPGIVVTTVTEASESVPLNGEPQKLKLSRKAARDYSAITNLPLKDARVVTAEASTGRSCLHLEIDIRANPQIKYKTGDHLAIWPTNPVAEVDRLLSLLNLTNEQFREVLIAPTDTANADIKIPKHSTIFALFRHYLEICAPVSRDTISTLKQFAHTSNTKSLLETLSTKSGYSTFIASNHVTFARLLEYTLTQDASASWAHLPLSLIIESLRPMTPRYYSICSSSMTSPRQMAITVAVSPTALPQNPSVAIPGLTSTYLSTTNPTHVYAHVRRSAFKMPFLQKTPIVLIAAGTGIAPFRAFLQERAQMAQISNQEIGPVLLVFGCRHPEQDFLYREEIEALANGPLRGKFEIVTAFSRVQGEKKVYVQDRLAEKEVQDKVVRMLVEDEGHLYFCGSTTMAKGAGRVLVDAVSSRQGLDEKKGKEWMDGLKKAKKWQEDVWG